MQPQTIKESAPETVEAIKAIERQADDCYKSLELLTVPGNLAIWGVLTEGIRLIEQAMAAHGDNSSDLDASLINLGRSLTTAIKWILAHGKAPSKLAAFRWTPDFARRAEQTVLTALQYASFETAFPMWHKDRYAAQLKSPRVVRFSSLSSTRERQVSAYQKGFRPTSGRVRGQTGAKNRHEPRSQAPLRRNARFSREQGVWKDATLNWIEETQENAVEVIATRSDSKTLALEHTLIELFVGEKYDSTIFTEAFEPRIEKNPEFIISGRALNVMIPVGALVMSTRRFHDRF